MQKTYFFNYCTVCAMEKICIKKTRIQIIYIIFHSVHFQYIPTYVYLQYKHCQRHSNYESLRRLPDGGTGHVRNCGISQPLRDGNILCIRAEVFAFSRRYCEVPRVSHFEVRLGNEYVLLCTQVKSSAQLF